MTLLVRTSFAFLPLNNNPKPLPYTQTTNSIIKCQNPSSQPPPNEPTPSSSSSSSSSSTTGLGFGSSTKPQNGKPQRAAVIRRRPPVEQPSLVSRPKSDENGEIKGRNESAFLLTWTGLGVVILAEGLALSASGFLPDEWDRFIVKYVYPIFTPTVGFFVAGTVVYGVLKYLQNDQLKK